MAVVPVVVEQMAQSALHYSDDDLENDVDIYMKEAFDLSLYSILDQGKASFPSGSEEAVYQKMNTFLETTRFLNFAREFVESEKRLIDRNDWEIVETAETLDSSSDEGELVIPLGSSAGPSVAKAQASKGELKQLRKDIERDQVLVNSHLLVGASLSLEGTIESIKRITQQILAESGMPSLPALTADHFSHAILFKSSRTHSGGIVFSTLQSLIDREKLLLVPQSAMSPPITVHIRLGVFPTHAQKVVDSSTDSQRPWGLICQVTSESYYLVNRMEEMMGDSDSAGMESSATGFKGEAYAGKLLKATYEDFVFFEIKLYGNEMSNVERIQTNDSVGPIIKVREVQSSKAVRL